MFSIMGHLRAKKMWTTKIRGRMICLEFPCIFQLTLDYDHVHTCDVTISKEWVLRIDAKVAFQAFKMKFKFLMILRFVKNNLIFFWVTEPLQNCKILPFAYPIQRQDKTKLSIQNELYFLKSKFYVTYFIYKWLLLAHVILIPWYLGRRCHDIKSLSGLNSDKLVRRKKLDIDLVTHDHDGKKQIEFCTIQII